MKVSDLKPPICVDLDGALIKTDLLVESFFALLKKNFALIFLAPFWLIKGKANLKHELAQRVEIDVSTLPYQQEFLSYLREEHAAGRMLLLVTAAHEKFAQQIADHLGLFAKVFATNASINLSGKRKLQRMLLEFGGQSFVYAADAHVDLRIWLHCRQAILVNPKLGVTRAAAKLAEVERVFDDRSGGIAAYARAMRLHQWLKNLLIFVPLLTSHRIGEPELVVQALVAFLAFGLCASSVYVLNDLLDLAADRQHPRKRYRMFAAGRINVLHGALLAPALLLSAFALALAFLPLKFVLVLLFYYCTTLAYSAQLKNFALIDVMVLAGLYTLRVIAGAAAVGVSLSFWLLAFSTFIFLSLALVKRYSELLVSREQGKDKISGREYEVDDLSVLVSMGAASGYLAVLVLALYINSLDVQVLYRQAKWIWLLCPLLLYWISRMWLITHRGNMHDDPIVFAVRDKVSLTLGVIGLVCVWAAT